MATIRVIIVVPAADVAAVEADLSAFGSFLLTVPLVPLSGNSESIPATHFAMNATCVMDGPMDVVCQGLEAAYPGTKTHFVQRVPPFYKAYSKAVHWTAWINAAGLQEQYILPE